MAHSQGAVQFHHRMVGYLLLVLAIGIGISAWRSKLLPTQSKLLANGVALAVVLQAMLGIATLMTRAPLGWASHTS